MIVAYELKEPAEFAYTYPRQDDDDDEFMKFREEHYKCIFDNKYFKLFIRFLLFYFLCFILLFSSYFVFNFMIVVAPDIFFSDE